ncbi:NADH pyrophosphatase [Rhodosporidiobolus nylandii]
MSQANQHAGNPLNRLSYLRSSPAFLTSALRSPKARFLALENLALLCEPPAKDGARHIATLGWEDVGHVISEAENVFKGVSGKDDSEVDGLALLGVEGKKTVGELSEEEKREYFVNQPALVFLGVDERSAPQSAQSLPLSKPDDNSTLETHSPYGIPYWALDVSRFKELKEKLLAGGEAGKREFADLRAGSQTMPAEEAAIGAEARSLVDWNTRNKFCPSCARPQRSIWAGFKRQCLPASPPSPSAPASPPCITRRGVHNVQYPRTDPVVIMAVLSPDREQILLGRQRSWPEKFYSCLAGFVESGESLEEAVRREVYEEAGVVCDEVGYFASQPWPYPASLMFGCYAVAREGQEIRCDLDNELEDARYFTRAQVLAVIENTQPMQLSREEVARLDGKEGISSASAEGKKDAAKEEALFRMPPSTAIANSLITAWAKGTLYTPTAKSQEGGKL